MAGSRRRARLGGKRFGVGLLLGAALFAGLVGCQDRNRGRSPVDKGLFFPAGLALDPRVPEDAPARWAFALNANSDLFYNAGTVIPVDLERFFAAWMRDPDRCFAGDAESCKPGQPPGLAPPKTPPADAADDWSRWPVVGDVAATLTEKQPCRRNALKPQVIECEDSYFLAEEAAVHVGNFGTSLRGWARDPDDRERDARLLLAVRGDPSITMVRIEEGDDGLPRLECGQGPDSGLYDELRCAGTGLLKYKRNDVDGVRIASEPSNILATPGDPMVLVTHATGPTVTLIDLDGQYVPAGAAKEGDAGCKGVGADVVCKDGKAAIVDVPAVFQLGNGGVGGGWGLARRPCFPGTDNVPALTLTTDANGDTVECGRSLIYAGFRTHLLAVRLFIAETTPQTGYFDLAYLDAVEANIDQQITATRAALDAAQSDAEREALAAQLAQLEQLRANFDRWRKVVDKGELYQRCLSTAELSSDEYNGIDPIDGSTAGAFPCDPGLFAAGLLKAAAFDLGLTSSALLGDIAFSKDGNRLFAVQTNPGGLAYVDTSLDSRGLTRDYEAGLVELCAQPTAMTLFSDEANEYAAITCYRPAELFIVDLSGVRVVANIVLGTGPHAITLDHARQYLYVANSLDQTISLVDISRLRPTRFSEVARIGLQVPYRN
jgi:hypothetical protein